MPIRCRLRNGFSEHLYHKGLERLTLCFNFEASSFGLDMTFPTPSRMLPPTLLRPAPSLCDDLGRRPLSCSSDTFLRYSSSFFCCCAIVCADFWFFFSNSCLMRVCCCR